MTAEFFKQDLISSVLLSRPSSLQVLEDVTPCTINLASIGQLNVTYSPSNDSIVLHAGVNNSSYMGFGYGRDTMENVNMVSWISDFQQSAQQDMYSNTFANPVKLVGNAYTTSWVVETDQVKFYSSRPLGLTAPDTYQIPLDTEFPVVFAGANVPFVAYHDSHVGSLTITLLSNGSCIFGPPPPPTVFGARTKTIHGLTLFTAWTLFALIQLSTNRYMKHLWRWR